MIYLKITTDIQIRICANKRRNYTIALKKYIYTLYEFSETNSTAIAKNTSIQI